MKISELSVRRPVLMTMVYVLIAIIAAVYISQIDIALIPDTEMPIISVMVSSDEDVGPELMEQQIARTLENSLSSMENLENMTSQCSSSNCIIVLEFSYGTDLDEAEEDVNSALSMVTRALPDWVDSTQLSSRSRKMTSLLS